MIAICFTLRMFEDAITNLNHRNYTHSLLLFTQMLNQWRGMFANTCIKVLYNCMLLLIHESKIFLNIIIKHMNDLFELFLIVKKHMIYDTHR